MMSRRCGSGMPDHDLESAGHNPQPVAREAAPVNTFGSSYSGGHRAGAGDHSPKVESEPVGFMAMMSRFSFLTWLFGYFT